jgi:hypothetical protein
VHTARACGVPAAFDARETLGAVMHSVERSGGTVLANEGVLVARGLAVVSATDARASNPGAWPYVLFVDARLPSPPSGVTEQLRAAAFVLEKLPGADTTLGRFAKTLGAARVRVGFFEGEQRTAVHRALEWLRAGDSDVPCGADYPFRVFRGAQPACAELAR